MSIVDDLERLSALHRSGALSDAEFEAQKALVLAADRSAGNAPKRRRIAVGGIAGAALGVAVVAAFGASKAGLIAPMSAGFSTNPIVPDASTSPMKGAV